MFDKRVVLIDINSYFAILLEQENPHLRGKPLAVVKDLGRTCVIAASKEAKKFGIKTGSNLVRAKQLCPGLIEVEAEFNLYLSATKRFKKLLESLVPNVIVYSLDEAFLDLSDCLERLYPDPVEFAQDLQRAVGQELGQWVTCNVGIGPNLFLAKMAAETAATAGIQEINEDNLDLALAGVGFNDVCGVGYRLASKLETLGITHPYQIRFYPQAELAASFGPFWAQELIKMAYGEEPHHFRLLVQSYQQKKADVNQSQPLGTKSISRSITLWDLMDDRQEMKRVIYNLTREVVHKARVMKLAGRQISLGLWGSDHLDKLSWKKHITYSTHFSHTQTIFDEVMKLLDQWPGDFRPIRFRVALSLLEPTNTIDTPLLPRWHKQEAIETALDEISYKYGLYAVHSGLLKPSKIIQPEVTGYLGDKDYQFSYRS